MIEPLLPNPLIGALHMSIKARWTLKSSNEPLVFAITFFPNAEAFVQINLKSPWLEDLLAYSE